MDIHDKTGEQLVHEIVAVAGAMRAIEEPVDLVLSSDEEDCYEMGLYFGAAATVHVLQAYGQLPVR